MKPETCHLLGTLQVGIRRRWRFSSILRHQKMFPTAQIPKDWN